MIREINLEWMKVSFQIFIFAFGMISFTSILVSSFGIILNRFIDLKFILISGFILLTIGSLILFFNFKNFEEKIINNYLKFILTFIIGILFLAYSNLKILEIQTINIEIIQQNIFIYLIIFIISISLTYFSFHFLFYNIIEIKYFKKVIIMIFILIIILFYFEILILNLFNEITLKILIFPHEIINRIIIYNYLYFIPFINYIFISFLAYKKVNEKINEIKRLKEILKFQFPL